ncbi:hypothetical protein ASE13_13560 [Sphingomonas sp. Root241]|nr:hypothetical protein ASE13_13560 [Sphingomonas sp. Root241]
MLLGEPVVVKRRLDLECFTGATVQNLLDVLNWPPLEDSTFLKLGVTIARSCEGINVPRLKPLVL